MDKNTKQTMFSSKSAEWATPQNFYNKLNRDFGPFTLDPCSDGVNNKTPKHFTEKDDGLRHWLKKAYDEGQKPNTTVVCLIPARTDTKYWHEYVMKAQAIYFVKGRLKFGDSENSAPFPSAVVIFTSALSPFGTLVRTMERE